MRLITALSIVLSCTAHVAQAQLPATRLDGVFPAGARPGTTVDVTLTGIDLDDATELHFSHPSVTAQPKMAEATSFDEARPVPNQFVVSVKGDAPIGMVEVRVRGKYGLSNPRVFELGELEELTESEPNNDREQAAELTLPQTVNGQINGATDVDMFRFTATAGQRILFDCRARRIDSLLEPLLSIYDGQGRELTSNRNGYSPDALIDFHVPSAGDYYVRVSDVYYRGNASYVYRLVVGSLPRVDFLFPPAGAAGSKNQYTVYGRNLPAGKPSEYYVDGQRLDQLNVQIAVPKDAAVWQPINGRLDPEQAFLDAIEYRLQGAAGLSNSICVGIAGAPPILETEANNSPQQAQEISPPCEVAGQFFPARDDDWYTFEAKQDDAYTIEVMSNRLGLPTDPLLIIHQVTKNEEGEEQVKVLATADDLGKRDRAQFDTRTGDAAFQFVAPVDATYRVTVRDGYSSLRSDPRLVYRLSIRQAQPDFRLVAVPQDPWGALVLRKGDRTTIDVLAERRDGLTEPITLTVTGLPAGVTSSSVTLGPSMTVASLVLTAADNATPAIANLKVSGTAKIADRDVTRVARCGTTNTSMRILQPNQQPPTSLPARVSQQLALSVVDDVAPFAMELQNDKVWETTRAGILKIPYTATRRNDYKGQVRCAVANLPANINPTTFNIAANNAKGEVTLTLRNTTPAGLYTLHAGAFVTAYSYARNPEAAAAAKQRKEAIDKIAAAADKAAKEATTASQQATQAATTAANQLKAAEQKQTLALKTAADADTARQQAEAAVVKAKAAVAAKPDDAGLQAAVSAAEKNVVAAVAKLKVATEAATAAQKGLEESQAAAQAATEKKQNADLAVDKAAVLAKAAAEQKKITDKQATDAEQAAKAKNINYWTASTPVTVRIHEYPVTLGQLPETTRLKQGEKTELPIRITRLVDYKDQVSFTTVVRGVSGLSISNVNIPKDKTEIMLPITAAATATPGKHEITLRATMRVNNQTLTFDQPFELEIEKVEPPK